MRTFHTGGVAAANITQGLPRVEELFEARKPKKTAFVAEATGSVKIELVKRTHNITITPADGSEELVYQIPFGTNIIVEDGSYVTAGTALTEGDMNPADILRISGIDAVYDYILLEVQKVYRSQGININDKHVEVIARQMTRKIKITDEGDTPLLSGSTINLSEYYYENDLIDKRTAEGEIGLRKAEGEPVLLGITKASLLTESFLSAASFQETTKVLTEAAIKGKTDHLLALKENVLIGRLIPAGTGMDRYRNVEVERTNPADSPIYNLDLLDLEEDEHKSYASADENDDLYSDDKNEFEDDSHADEGENYDDDFSDNSDDDFSDGEDENFDDAEQDEE